MRFEHAPEGPLTRVYLTLLIAFGRRVNQVTEMKTVWSIRLSPQTVTKE